MLHCLLTVSCFSLQHLASSPSSPAHPLPFVSLLFCVFVLSPLSLSLPLLLSSADFSTASHSRPQSAVHPHSPPSPNPNPSMSPRSRLVYPGREEDPNVNTPYLQKRSRAVLQNQLRLLRTTSLQNQSSLSANQSLGHVPEDTVGLGNELDQWAAEREEAARQKGRK